MADLYHKDGNATQAETLKPMKPSKNLGSNAYGYQRKGPKTPTKKVTEKGWSK